jgi:hypothetical protein
MFLNEVAFQLKLQIDYNRYRKEYPPVSTNSEVTIVQIGNNDITNIFDETFYAERGHLKNMRHFFGLF